MAGGSIYQRGDRGTWILETRAGGKRVRTKFASPEAAEAARDGAKVVAAGTLAEWLTSWSTEIVPKLVESKQREPKTARTYRSRAGQAVQPEFSAQAASREGRDRGSGGLHPSLPLEVLAVAAGLSREDGPSPPCTP